MWLVIDGAQLVRCACIVIQCVERSVSLAVPGAMTFLPARLLLIVVGVLVLVLLLLLLHLLPVVHLILAEALIKVLVDAASATLACALRITASGLSSAATDSVAPAPSRLARVHLREEQAEHSLTVRPIEVVQLHGDFLLRLRRGLLTLVVLLGELASRFDERQEFGLLVTLFCRHFRL